MTNRAEQSIVVRAATLDDAPAIGQIHVESWRSTYRGIVPDSVLSSLDYDARVQTWRRDIVNTTRGRFVVVAEMPAGQIVGFVSGGPERTGDHPDFSGEIYALYVDDAWHGHGVGRALITAGVQALQQRGHRAMLIWALSRNPACGFYRRLGGVEIARQDVEMGRAVLEETAFGWENIAVLLEHGQ